MTQHELGQLWLERAAVWVLLVSVTSFALLQSMVVPALPWIQIEYRTDLSTVTWVLTAYLLSATVAIPLIGRAGDLMGKKRMLVLSLLALALGSVVATLAPTIEMLIVARVIQGIGGGVIPLSFAIMRDISASHVERRVTLIASLVALGFGGGIVIAGPILDLGFRWLFVLPAFATTVAATAAVFTLPSDARGERVRVPLVPAILLASWLVALLLAVTQGRTWGWTTAPTCTIGLLAAVLFAAWVASETRRKVPLVDLRLMRRRGVWSANVVGVAMGFAVFAALGFLPQFLHAPPSRGYGFGASPSEAGFILLPLAAVSCVAGLVTARLVRWLGSRAVICGGSALACLSFAWLAAAHDHRWQVVLGLALLGAGTGLVFSCIPIVIVTAVAPNQTAIAAGMNANMRTMGGAIGVAVIASLLASRTDSFGRPLEAGYVLSFYLLGIAMLASVVAACFVPESRVTSGAGSLTVTDALP